MAVSLAVSSREMKVAVTQQPDESFFMCQLENHDKASNFKEFICGITHKVKSIHY